MHFVFVIFFNTIQCWKSQNNLFWMPFTPCCSACFVHVSCCCIVNIVKSVHTYKIYKLLRCTVLHYLIHDHGFVYYVQTEKCSRFKFIFFLKNVCKMILLCGPSDMGHFGPGPIRYWAILELGLFGTWSVWWFLYWPFCHGAIKLGMSTLFTTFFLWTLEHLYYLQCLPHFYNISSISIFWHCAFI